jgi:hypothetical protein
MASSSDSEDDSVMAVDQEETALEGTMEQDEDPHPVLEVEETRHNRSMSELPEEVLEYILSFLSPYQEHKTAALVCKQWYRLIKGTLVLKRCVCVCVSIHLSICPSVSMYVYVACMQVPVEAR